LAAISERTDQDEDELRSMTIAGSIPWLLDSLKQSADLTAFDTYVHRCQILISHRAVLPARSLDGEHG